jgi:hypothetical protein
MGDALRAAACYVLCLVAAWLILRDVRELFIAWYSGVGTEIPMSVRVAAGMQILVNLAAMWLALMAA